MTLFAQPASRPSTERKAYLRTLILAAASKDTLLDRLSKAAGWNPEEVYAATIIADQRHRKAFTICPKCKAKPKDAAYGCGCYCRECSMSYARLYNKRAQKKRDAARAANGKGWKHEPAIFPDRAPAPVRCRRAGVPCVSSPHRGAHGHAADGASPPGDRPVPSSVRTACDSGSPGLPRLSTEKPVKN